ncbi:HAD-IA family hydrolase [Streptomyces decoyicus]
MHVLSEVLGMAKPNPAIYRLALERLRLPGSACVFADDHPVNLPPAEALRITTVLARREADRVAELQAILGMRADLAA